MPAQPDHKGIPLGEGGVRVQTQETLVSKWGLLPRIHLNKRGDQVTFSRPLPHQGRRKWKSTEMGNRSVTGIRGALSKWLGLQ